MPLPNAYAQYNNSKILTATPSELTLMLYEGAIKFCNIAISAVQQKDIEKAHKNIQKTQKIIEHFRMTLDMKYPVAKEFDTVYDYIYRRLVEANMKKNQTVLDDALKHIKTMRETWKEVMRLNNAV